MVSGRVAELSTILDAHGGLDYWRTLSAIDVEFSASGFLFTAKRVPPQHHVRLTISTRTPEATLHDYPEPGQHTTLYGTSRVETTAADGAVLQTRVNPRAAFARPRPWTSWDALDFAYFSGYAMWNYLTLPAARAGHQRGSIRASTKGRLSGEHSDALAHPGTLF